MSDKTLTVDEILAMLAAAPARIAAATTGLTPAEHRTAPAPGDWSANETLAHLRACADVWGNCIETILAEEHPTIRAIDPRTWIEGTDYLELALEPSLRAYATQRERLLAVLRSLATDAWARSATMTGAGRPIERTVQSFARRMAIHERPHLKQIDRAAHDIRRQR